ncbi:MULTISPECIES: TonB-dependent siderophore receptor [Emticicia]|uniref:TonB-dependent receptor plug domain-containing protein n=1 Tax=Emticicia TaxID=312278 RepID=UPI0007D8B599|nr:MULTISPECIES: TonB-dependent receptor [Emticicia]
MKNRHHLIYKFRIKILIGILIISAQSQAFTQNVSGIVLDKSNGKEEPIIGASVNWLGTKVATNTDIEGKFSIARSKSKKLIISFVGYKSDTLEISNENDLRIYLISDNQLQEVVVRSSSTSLDRLSPIHTEIITSKALAKAACCNLSESFETNASVSVSYADAVTGAKQIQLLGLAGTYVQTNVENIPSLRGLATTFGLNYIPGTWIQSIDIGKGAGSVVNGYESMTGQINVELQKPDLAEKIYLNTYVNSLGRGEVNLNLAHIFKTKNENKKWSTALLSHGSSMQTTIDKNNDNFYDLPQYTQANFINRWKYESDKMVAQFGVKYLYDTRMGGQINKSPLSLDNLIYRFSNTTSRAEFFSKTAKLYQTKPYRGLGLIINGVIHDSKSQFGFRPYNGKQETLYGNLIYQDIFGNTNHSYKVGASFLYDNFDEKFADLIYKRNEIVKGAFFEYTYKYLDKLTTVAGTRLDFHNLYGTIFTPRLHILYNATEKTALRFSAGKGFRTANPFAEYFGNLVSSRTVRFLEKINPEVSWNFGASLTKSFGKSNIIIDLFHTYFENQLIGDTEHPNFLYFYNSQGRNYANSAQVELNLIPMPRLEFKLAYRYSDVWQTLGKSLGQEITVRKMFVPRDRVLFNVGYALPFDKWKFDFTVQYNGIRRVPNLSTTYIHTSYESMPIRYAPAFANINAQISRSFRRWDVYLGGENLNNFTQKDPIVTPDNPFGSRFDAGSAWGPVVGRIIYFGTRYKLGGRL